MAFVHGKGSAVFVAQYDMSSDLTQYSFSKQIQTVDTTTFGASDKTYIAGLHEGSINVQGLFNVAGAGNSDTEFNAILGTESVISASPQGFTAIGDRAHMVNGFVENYQPRSPNNDAVRFTCGLQASAGAYNGVCLHHNNQESSTGNFASVDNTAATSNGATAFLHVTQFSGTNATVTIEDSANDIAFGSLVAFTAATGLTSEKKTVSGSVLRYARVALTGTFTTITFVVSFARHLP